MQNERLEHGFPPTVLMVEHEVLIRLVLACYLRDCGYKVIEASNGEEALQVLCKTGIPIDIVFSDVQVPGATSGFALAKYVRLHYPHTRVVLTSGFRAADAARALCADFTPHSYDATDIADLIQLLLTRIAQSSPRRP